MTRKVAVVTGANKGIGLAIVKGLCEKLDGDVFLTSRDIGRGEKAVKDLRDMGFTPFYHQLDVTDDESIEKFHDFIKEKFGGIDILINNAGVSFSKNKTEPILVQAKITTNVNYFGLASVCRILFPLLRENARVVNVSSSSGHLARIPGKFIREVFAKSTLTELELNELVKDYLESVKKGSYVAEGWGESSYVVSKVAVCALTFIQNREYGDKYVSVNCVHPGWVATDMTDHEGPLTVEQGSAAPLYLALEAPSDIRGVYMWHNKKIVDWFGERPSGD